MSAKTNYEKEAFNSYADNVEFDGAAHRIELINDMFKAWLEKELKEVITDEGGELDEDRVNGIINNTFYYQKTIELLAEIQENCAFFRRTKSWVFADTKRDVQTA